MAVSPSVRPSGNPSWTHWLPGTALDGVSGQKSVLAGNGGKKQGQQI